MFELRSLLRAGFRYALASNSVLIARLVLAFVVIVYTARLVSNAAHRWEAVLLGVAGSVLVLLLRRAAGSLRVYVDRKFFREAYDAERILGELGSSIVNIRDRKLLVETVGRQIEAALHPLALAVLLENDSAYTLVHSFGIGLTEPATIQPTSSILRLLRQQNGAAKVNFADPQSWVHGVSELDQYVLGALHSRILIPLTVDTQMRGILSLGAKRSEAPYSRQDVRLLSAVGSQMGLALENIRLTDNIRREIAERERIHRELEIAREVQQRLFPQTLPRVTGLDFAGYCRPALGVGGDYYDFIHLDDGCLGIAIGDVSGKGIAAALLMASLQASLRAQTIRPCDKVSEMIENVNRLVFDASADNRYATFFYAQYQPSERSLRFVNAGHNAPILLCRQTGQLLRLEQGGTVLGMFARSPYVETRQALAPGDILVGFTDGISEAENMQGEEFGEERLIAAIRRAEARSAADLLSSILSEVDAFTGRAQQHDDMTLLIIRVDEQF